MMSTAGEQEEVEDDFSIMSCWSPQKKVVIVNVPLKLSTRTKMSSSSTDRLPASVPRMVNSLRGLAFACSLKGPFVCSSVMCDHLSVMRCVCSPTKSHL